MPGLQRAPSASEDYKQGLLAMATDQTTPRIAIFNMEIVPRLLRVSACVDSTDRLRTSSGGGNFQERFVVAVRVQVGTVNPVLPVIAELAKRGCDVRYYLTKDGKL